jgi:hypothetical protein
MISFLAVFLLYRNRTERTVGHTGAALDTFCVVDRMWFFLVAGDCFYRTVARTLCTAFALLRVDGVNLHGLAYMCTAFVLLDMLNVFVAEILQGTDDRKRCALAKSAE